MKQSGKCKSIKQVMVPLLLDSKLFNRYSDVTTRKAWLSQIYNWSYKSYLLISVLFSLINIFQRIMCDRVIPETH